MSTEEIQLVKDWETVRVEMAIHLVEGRYECVSLTLSEASGLTRISSALLRDIPVHRWLAEVIESQRPARVPRACHCRKMDCPALLKQVAEIYRDAYRVRYPPKKAVSECLEMPGSTASRWIREARKAGLISSAPTSGDLSREA